MHFGLDFSLLIIFTCNSPLKGSTILRIPLGQNVLKMFGQKVDHMGIKGGSSLVNHLLLSDLVN